MRPQVGQVINNKYRLLRLIGDGGMGSVYEARHEVLGTSVALKFLHAELGKRAGLVQRFLQEARVSALIASPHVVRVTDVDQSANGAFIVMEYIEGKTLQTLYEELYKAGLQLSQADAIEYAMQMLEGVEAAHRQGIVHRDLKPDNVMITLDPKGRPLIKLLDFGIAKLRASAELEQGLGVGGDPQPPARGLTRPGVIMGTPEYMAPEQAYSADAVDARADIFSLGVIIFEMLAGRRPVGGDEPHQIAGAYLSGQIARLTELAPDVPKPLADAIHRAMAPIAIDRWASVSELRAAMEPYAPPPRPPTALPHTPGSPSLETSGITPAPRLVSSASVAPLAVGAAPLAVGDAPLPVSKTLPPESRDANANGAERSPETNRAAPPAMSESPLREPTPLGGFGVPGAAPIIPETRSVFPLSQQHDPGATAPISAALMPFAAGASVQTPAPPVARASLDGTAPLAPSAFAVPGPGHDGGHPHAPSRADLAARVSTAPLAPAPPPVRSPARAPSTLRSLPAILLLAAGVSAAVVGGVYVAHNQAKADDHEDPVAMPAPVTVAPDPQPVDNSPAPPTTPTLAPTTPHAPPPRTLPPKSPPPKGSAGPVPPPSATAPDPLFPLPPIIVPSSFPDLPFFPQRRDDPPPREVPGPRSPQRPNQPPPRGDRYQPGYSRGRPPPPDEPPYDHAVQRDPPYAAPPPDDPWRRPAGPPPW